MAARVSGHAGAAGSSSTALRQRHASVLSWHLWHPCRERKMLQCQSLFLVVPTPLWQEQSQTTIPHLRLLPVELQPPSQAPCACMPGARGPVHPYQAASSIAAMLAGPTTLSCCVSWGRPCESALLPCSSCDTPLRPCPTVTQTIVLTTTECRRVLGSGLRRPLARFAAAVYKSPPTPSSPQ